MKPVIGILTCGCKEKTQFVTDSYIRVIRISGALPVLIPVLPPDEDFAPFFTMCDGFLLPGGGDITPLLFDEAPLPGIGVTNLNVDLFQIRFTRELLAAHKPVLAICRGMQVLNAACRGTIYQDLSQQEGTPFLHMQTSQSRSDISHKVLVSPDSLLHGIIGDVVYTNSFHHQSVHLPGELVQVSARAGDGTIEAIEVSDQPFALGVQWHPEAMFFSSLRMRNLFSTFIENCKNDK